MTAVDGGTTALYAYDALGRRVYANIEGGYEFWYFYDPAGNMVADWVPGGLGIDELMEPVAGRVLASYENDRNDVFLKHQNALGSWGLTTYPDGSVAQDEHYYPWGQPWAAGSYVVELNFAGMGWHDTESSLDWTPARCYESSLGRWLSPDPAGVAAVDPSNPQSFNQYAYVLNNPTSNVDPSGLDPCPDQPDNPFCIATTSTPNPPPGCDPNDPSSCSNSPGSDNGGSSPIPPELEQYWFWQEWLQWYTANGPARTNNGTPANNGVDILGTLGQFFRGRPQGQTFTQCVNENISLLSGGTVDPNKLFSQGMAAAEGVGSILALGPGGTYSGYGSIALGTRLLKDVTGAIGLTGATRVGVVTAGVAVTRSLAVAGAATAGALIGSAANCASPGVF